METFHRARYGLTSPAVGPTQRREKDALFTARVLVEPEN